MDFTIEVMLPPRGDTDYSRSAHSKMGVLSPVAVYERKNVEAVGMPRTGYIHVTDCPYKDAASLSQELCRVHDEHQLAEGQVTRAPIAKRVWVADPAFLPQKAFATLLSDRQFELTWAEFEAMYVNAESARTLKSVSEEIAAVALLA